MPAISEMLYGFDAAGVEAFLSELKTEHIDKAKNAIMNYGEIKTACDNSWSGTAKDNFLANLDKDAKHVCNQLDEVYKILATELNTLMAAMAKKDHDIISVDE